MKFWIRIRYLLGYTLLPLLFLIYFATNVVIGFKKAIWSARLDIESHERYHDRYRRKD